MSYTPAALVLADGKIFRGRAFGATGRTLGEAVFTTAMTGYQETMTDPSYHRQIVVATAPQIGNTGWNDEDSESRGDKIWVAGLAIRDLSRSVSNWRADRSLTDEMEDQGIIGIQNVDTRAIVRHLRDKGSVAAGIFSGDALTSDLDMLSQVQAQPSMEGADLSADVSTDELYVVEPEGETKYTVIAYDMGIKTNTPREFSKRGVRSVVVPSNTSFEEVQKLMEEYNATGVFISNGPGDPATADATVEELKKILEAKIPFFGICFGNQLLGRALGMETYKLKFGHRGANHPVKDLRTGKISITSQNHGFAVDPDTVPDDVEITLMNLNDNTVEGIAHKTLPVFSVQYHPEAAPGPRDPQYLFRDFKEMIASGKGKAVR